MRRHSRVWRTSSLVVAMIVGPVVGACGSDDPPVTDPPATASTATEPATTDPPATPPPATEPPATDPPATAPPATEPPATAPPTTTTAPEPPATEPPVGSALVNVYWAWTVVNTGDATPERIGAGARAVPADTPVRNALEALFDGPNALEADLGMLNLVPQGTRVRAIAVDGSTATVDLSSEFEDTLGGTLAESMQLAQVVFTVTQFDGLDRVKFQIDGEPRDSILTHGFEVGDGLTRDDFANIRATILVERPFPGQAVGNPLVVRGESSAFEATIQWRLTTGGGDGVVIAEGFTTDGGTSGTFLPFAFEIDLTTAADTYAPGPGSIILFESSPIDGSETWVVEIPIELPER